ncbi:hypothetical protein C8A01DRAFT_14926 [Parachaetomium inaequale]|uniref:Uncharacterized protein n=1 Tax=Parachaetomium inaequale TaxID=2588326 RepID=A0AAN6PIH1_9PEZI|nr:hypothetical protein C8A01DRAFT_14926 [Parachaetomium inaequale]
MPSPNPAGNANGNGIAATALPSPLLRKATILSFLPALPLCITHGALSNDVVPALGLIPLFFSAGVSLFLLVRSRRDGGKGKGMSERGGRADLEGLRRVATAAGVEQEEEEGQGIGPDDDDDDDEDEERDGGSVLTHRISVFVVDVVLAAGLMVVLVFTWIRTGQEGERRPELAMLAAYGTVPLLVNFLIHLYLAVCEFVAGLAIPALVEYSAWHVVSPDCPHCGNRLRPESLPPIPWHETVSRPNVSLPQITAPSISRPSLPAFKLPNLSGLKGAREWKVPSWMRGRNQDASLFVDDDQNERDRYRDDPDGPFDEPSGTTTVVATGSAVPAPVEVVVGKKDRRENIVPSAGWPEDEDEVRF